VYALLLAAVFPSLKGSAGLNELVDKYPAGLKSLFGLSAGADLTTGAGYFDAELFAFMLPLFALILAIGSGTRALAGEEDSGRLELLFAYPLRRRDGVLAKGAAVGVEIAVFAAAVFAALSLLDPVFGVGLSTTRLAAAMLSVGVLALLHGWLALAVAALTPSRALATGVPAAFAAAAYLIAGLHGLAGWLDPLRFLSSFWWISRSPLQDGVSAMHLLVVAAAAAGTLAAAAYLIERRDLKTP
jgi:ABC-2 type transport system permease protein